MTPCSLHSRTKNPPREEVLGTDIPQTSGGHSHGYPGPRLRSGRSKYWKKNKHLGADIHDPKARTSMTLRDLQKLRSEKLWAEFHFPTHLIRRGHSGLEILRDCEKWVHCQEVSSVTLQHCIHTIEVESDFHHVPSPFVTVRIVLNAVSD